MAVALWMALLACPRNATAAPANDNFANATSLGSGGSGQVSGDNIGATYEAGEPFHAGFGGYASVWYIYTPAVAGTAVFSIGNNTFDTVLAVYTGTRVNALTQVASNDDYVGRASRVSFTVVAGTRYYIAVDGFGGLMGSFTLTYLGPGSTVTPVITSATVSAPRALSFSYQISATNSPQSYAASGLPAGLTLDATTGLITGTPTTNGTYSVAITAANLGGSATGYLTLTIANFVNPKFFTGETAVSDTVRYLSFPNGNFFGYYAYLSDPRFIYHMDLGFECVFNASDGRSGVYLYDFESKSFFYTSPTYPFPYMYDFGLRSVVYYYPNPDQENYQGRYNTNGVRYFYVFKTNEVIVR